jgi:putative transposase
MKRLRYTDQQIAQALRQVEQGTAVAELCRQLGVSETTFYHWKKRYAGMGVAELRRVKQLEEVHSSNPAQTRDDLVRLRRYLGKGRSAMESHARF